MSTINPSASMIEILAGLRDGHIGPKTEGWDGIAPAVNCLKRLDAIDEQDRVTRVGQRLISWMELDQRITARYARVLVESVGGTEQSFRADRARKNPWNCLRDAVATVAVLACGRPLFERDPYKPFNTQSDPFARSGDLSDVQPLMRGYRLLVKTQSERGDVRAVCQQHGMAYDAFVTANRLHQRLLDASRRFGLVFNEGEENYEALAYAFLTGFGEQLMVSDRRSSHEVLDGSELRLARHSRLVGRSGPIVPARIVEVRGESYALVTAAMAVTVDQLKRRFGKRFRIEDYGHHEDEWEHNKIWCWMGTFVDDLTVTKEMTTATSTPNTQKFVASRFWMYGREHPLGGDIKLLRRLQQAALHGMMELPGLTLDRVAHCMVAKFEGRSSDQPVALTWADLEGITRVTGLEEKVREVEKVYPVTLIVQGQRLNVTYCENGTIRVEVNLEQGQHDALREFTGAGLPAAWAGRSVILGVKLDHLNWYSSNSVEAVDLDRLRCQVAVRSHYRASVYLPQDADKLWVEVTVHHPQGRTETVYAVACRPGAFTREEAEVCLRTVVQGQLLTRGTEYMTELCKTYGRDLMCLEDGDVAGAVTSALAVAGCLFDPANVRQAFTAVCETLRYDGGARLRARSDRRRRLLTDACALYMLARERRADLAGDYSGLLSLLRQAREQLQADWSGALALPSSVLDIAEELVEQVRPRLPAITEADALRLELRNELEDLRRLTERAQVEGSVRTAVRDLLRPVSALLDAGRLVEARDAMPALTAAIAVHCSNPKPATTLRGGLSSTGRRN